MKPLHLLNTSKTVLTKSLALLLVPLVLVITLPDARAAQSAIILPDQDAFVSSTATTGNRRMLFIGTFTDTTVCTPNEGCPPVYQDSRALLKFQMTLPANTLPVSAELKFFHYASNADINITVSRITQPWTETTAVFPGPSYEGSYGSKTITSFNTTNPAQIKEESISLKPELITQLIQNNNGFLLRPTIGQDQPGIALCSKDSDSFCQPHHAPQLVIQYIQNNAPNVPVPVSPLQGATIGGNCDESVEPQAGICRDLVPATFTLGNLGDMDPVPGDLDKTVIDFFQNNVKIRSSDPIPGPGSASWTGSFPDGSYQWKARSVDKAGIWSNYSIEQSIQFDSTPPEVPLMSALPQTVNSTETTIQINGSKTTDSGSTLNRISYQLSFSDDVSFQTGVNVTAWQLDNPVFQQSTSMLKIGQPYYFRMKARDSAGNISNWSDTEATTIIDTGTIGIPTIDTNGWGIADGVLADGLKPERSRLTAGYVLRSATLTISGTAETDRDVELFINNTATAKVTPACTVSVCSYSYTLQMTDNGANNSTGIPLNSYAIQVRAITKTGRTSPLSPKEIVYHDTQAPSQPDVNITASNISLIENPLTRETQITVDTRSERYSDIQYYLTAPNGRITETRIWRTPYNKSSRLVSQMRLDGEYTITIKVTDAAGNTSKPKVLKINRDTTAPSKPIVEPYICSNNVCVKAL
jgi:Bacterial Ig-like domain